MKAEAPDGDRRNADEGGDAEANNEDTDTKNGAAPKKISRIRTVTTRVSFSSPVL